MFTVDIDTGGTMTDALVSDGTRRHSFKVDTTPHDYTVSFVSCLDEAAKQHGSADIAAFLRKVGVIRWSSTITTNVLAERRGAKVGLLVSKGHETDLYGEGPSPVVNELVSADSIIGLSSNADAAEILGAVKQLLESGVRRICISLRDAFPDNRAELALKRVIEDQYPDHIIGAVPVLLGSEMAPIGHDQTRAHFSLMNAYTHNALANSLFKAEDLLRDNYGWNGALLIGHTSGGVSRIGKTKSVDTIESGPVFGTFGGAFMAREYGIDNVICFDVGGTTTKASVVRGGEPVFQRGGELMGVPVQVSMAMLRSAAIGGGSIARAGNGRLSLGPESMGATPGPACYGLGGSEATLTDALLVLGYLDADSFLGGRRRLDVAKSRAVIERTVGKPLDMTVDVAAIAIRDEAVAIMAELVQATLVEAGLDPKSTGLFAFGGNGPMFGAFVAEKLGLPSVHAFDLGPVFSAFGSGISDVVHVYERGVGRTLDESARDALLKLAGDLHRQAVRDLEGEGFAPTKSRFIFEGEFGAAAAKAGIECESAPDLAWFAAFEAAAAQAGIDLAREPLQLLRLRACFPVSVQALTKLERKGSGGESIMRPMSFNGGGPKPRLSIRWESLGVADRVDGPAMVNGSTLTCPVPPGWSLTVDTHGNACLRRA